MHTYERDRMIRESTYFIISFDFNDYSSDLLISPNIDCLKYDRVDYRISVHYYKIIRYKQSFCVKSIQIFGLRVYSQDCSST